ncbi:MAG: AMP-binding protein, partial [Burkholderiales bacterium]|nr:AMP-binding protein [Burkholderiales bacterium]
PPLSQRTISEWLDATAEASPDRTACVFREQGLRWTWQQLRDESDRLAAALLQLGFTPGERLGIWSPNRSEWVLAQYATARIGVILVNINPAYRLAELEYALNKVECKGLITAPAFKSSEYLKMLQTLAPELAHCEPGRLASAKLPHLRTVIRMGDEATPGMFNLPAVLALADAESVAAARRVGAGLGCLDAINIQFTSGTTGNPKGATLSHHNIVNNARDVARTMNFAAGDILCVPVPLYHCFGMVMSSLACAVTGGTMVFPGEGFDPLATLQALHAERCTHLHGVPTMFIAELDHPRFAEFDLTSLRGGIMAGSPCPIEVMKRVDAQMHMREVTIAYGMTETSPVSFQSSTDDPLDKRVSTVGRVMPHLEVKIVDAEGRIVAVGEKGELCTKGYSVMQGYWADEARSAEAVVDGWMHTGDLATFDAEGYCNIVGRVKDMLIRGGENVYPREIEEFLFRHPKVAQVQVFGVPDLRYGEEICAWIVLKPGESSSAEEIKAFCKDQIAHYKVPRYVRFVDELPMTVTGKAQKFLMRERMIGELGLSELRTA